MAFESQTIQDITLLMHGSSSNVIVHAQEGDTASRVVRCRLKTFNNEDYLAPQNALASIYVKKYDGTAIWNTCTIDEDGVVTAELTTDMAVPSGASVAQFVFATENGDIKSQTFFIKVPKSPYCEDAIQSSNEMGVLRDLITECQVVADEKMYMHGIIESASQATAEAEDATAEAMAAVAACEGIVNGMNVMVDPVDNRSYRLGVEGGKLFIESIDGEGA